MQKKHNSLGYGLMLLAGILLFAGILLHLVLSYPADPAPGGSSSDSLHLMDQFNDYIARKTAVSEAPAPEEKKAYVLHDSDLVAPEPDEGNYGQAKSAEEIDALLQNAAGLLDGQPCYFSSQLERMPGSPVRYYLDETVFAVTWKEVHQNCVYTFSEVKIAHPSQFRRFLSDGSYGSGKQYFTSEMAASVNAVVASNGDFYAYRHTGTNIYNGKVYSVDRTGLHTCLIDENGDLHFAYPEDLPDLETAQNYVEENQIRFGLSFGPVLIENGALKDFGYYYLGEVDGRYSRAALCQMGRCHYLVCTANYEGEYRKTPTMREFAQVLLATGCQQAYAIDGGQSATLVMQDEVINTVSYGSQRKVSDIIYFATAVPQEGK